MSAEVIYSFNTLIDCLLHVRCCALLGGAIGAPQKCCCQIPDIKDGQVFARHAKALGREMTWQ